MDGIAEKQMWKDNCGNKIVFIKSWNEWGEGNYLEPDLLVGDAFIKEMCERYK